jgi:hypothetical protein
MAALAKGIVFQVATCTPYASHTEDAWKVTQAVVSIINRRVVIYMIPWIKA